MKKIFALSVCFFIMSIFSYAESIEVYFPANDCIIEYDSPYFNSIEEVFTEKREFKGKTVINKAVRNIFGIKCSLHSIKDDSVILDCDVLDDGTITKSYGYCILKKPGNKWTYQDPVDNERYEFESDIASVELPFAKFDNCIRVKQKIYLNEVLFGAEYFYYYKGIGLVQWELRNPENKIVQKQTIRNEGESYKISQVYAITKFETE